MISIVIPTHSRSAHLREAIEGVLAQTYPDWELLLVDDGSTDETASVIARYAARDGRIRALHQAHRGISAARNVGMRRARGALIAFLDDDDRWLPGYLDAQVTFLGEHPECGWAFTFAYQIDGQGRRTGAIVPHRCRTSLAHLLSWRSMWLPSQTVVRRECLQAAGEFDERIPVTQDRDLWIRLIYRYPVGQVPSVQVEYREHRGGISKNRRLKIADYITILKKLRHDPPPGVSSGWCAREAGRLHYQLAWESLDGARYADAAHHFLGAVTVRPDIGLRMPRRQPRPAAFRLLAPYLGVGYALARAAIKRGASHG
ncbi:MAG: glycosyltransferase [Candidatus Omnitrophica bacterium]|nr:glycosyltransferase [Candidatus Omnitrophota bacterium]